MTTSNTNQLTFSFLPAYEVRISHRARRLQLRVLPPGKVEVVVPKGVALKHVPGFVAEHEEWLRHALANTARVPAVSLPETIFLAAAAETWHVEYVSSQQGRVTVKEGAIQIAACSEARYFAMLQTWLTQRAKAVLIPWLSAVSRDIGLSYTSTSVRAQRTCWASCSNRQHISLNRAALFLPPATVCYLLVHELCHTVHLSHSRRYWKLVERFVPDYREHESVLRRVQNEVPGWALHR